MAAFGLYTHIRSNRRRSILLLGGLFLLVYLMVYAGALMAGAFLTPGAPLDEIARAALDDFVVALPFATAGTALWIAIAWRFHQRMIDAVTGGHDVTRAEQPRLYNLLENLCISRGITMPRLKIIDDAALNAFATGLNEKQYAISVTSGLVERLDEAELEAVLAHELTHIRNGDVRLLVIAVVIAGAIGFFGEMFFRLLFRGGFYASRRGGWGTHSGRRSGNGRGGAGGAILAIIIAVAIVAIAWFLSQVIRFSLSRRREFLADAGAVELTKNPDAMIGALRKIENRGELARGNSAVMEMCVDNPHSGIADLFATHPSIDRRVEALVRYAGGRDPGPLTLDPPESQAPDNQTQDGPTSDSQTPDAPAGSGPWGEAQSSQTPPAGTPLPGPWGPRS